MPPFVLPLLEPVLLTNLSAQLIGKSPVSVILQLKNYIAADWGLKADSEVVERMLINAVKNN